MSEFANIDTRPQASDSNSDLPEVAPLNDHQVRLDSLLDFDTFICINDDDHAGQNGVGNQSETRQTEPSASNSNGGAVSSEKATTASCSAAATAVDATPIRTRTGGATEDLASKRPPWLPEGWQIEVRVRSSGQTAGTTDRYYVEPVSGRKFRSKNEVFYFLETGSTRKRKNNADADADARGFGGHKEKKSGSGSARGTPFYFDFKNVPQKVSWVLTNASKEIWIPSIGDQVVPESTMWEWAAAFSHVSQGKKTMPPN